MGWSAPLGAIVVAFRGTDSHSIYNWWVSLALHVQLCAVLLSTAGCRGAAVAASGCCVAVVRCRTHSRLFFFHWVLCPLLPCRPQGEQYAHVADGPGSQLPGGAAASAGTRRLFLFLQL